ncbi:MAG: TIGR00282 family metallophosphoesterase [Alphaproteobacteria bacterium]|nr:TIGR00282 family metallophosphoesterase [Alphaproteobacteria bacterium]
MKVLFCGDVAGAAGRKAVKEFVPKLKQKLKLDGIIINGENAAHGLGLTPKTYQELIRAGADVITMGNHTFDKMDVVQIWQEENVLVRALNYPQETVGKGYHIATIANKKVAVAQVLGRTFMNSKIELADPFQTIQAFIQEHQSEYDILIVDFHAETTAEKIVMGYQLDGQAALVVGTHTHIPTNDAHVLPGGTAYISDIGMCGDYTSVIGMTRETAFTHFGLGVGCKRLEPATATSTLCAVYVEIDDKTNLATSIHPIILGDTLENTKDLC